MFFPIGLLIGFIAAIPLGPINVFIISQTMKRDFFHGFMGGITACVLDTGYCLVAILGMSHITSLINRWVILLKAVAALFMFAISVRLYFQSKKGRKPKSEKIEVKKSPKPILAVFLMYISNPTLLAFWLGTAGMVTSHYWVTNDGLTPYLFALACGLGGVLWYFILTRYVAKYHHMFSPKTFRRIFVGMALILFTFGAYTFASIFVDLKLHF
ncbi:MAG: LysE family transporter [Acidobacteriota bacterium]|nr:LysE family transporter [Acidobacteriota bacterium]